MIRVLELFAGIGACSKALTNLGIEHEIVDAVEIDKYAIKSFNAIHGTNFEPQDITKWDKDIECDLIMHGSPCQDFSVAGKGAGGDKDSGTRSSLMYETLMIVEKLKPKYVIWENVKNLLSAKHRHNFDAYLEAMERLGYCSQYQVLNAKDYGVPQNRERVFTLSIKRGSKLVKSYTRPQPRPLEIRLKDILEDEVEERYYLTDEQTKRLKMTTYNTGSEKVRVQNTDGEARILCARDYKDPKCVQVAQLYGFGKEPNPQAGRVYDGEGISPTMGTMSGGNRMPKIVASRGRGENNEQHLEPRKDNLTNTITSVQKDNYVAEPQNIPVRLGETDPHQKGGVYSDKAIAPTMTATTYKQPIQIKTANKLDGFRIRKLTPRECWRLMGFDDADFDKAQAVGISNTQLYKQAGNSIVVNCLEAIFNGIEWGDNG